MSAGHRRMHDIRTQIRHATHISDEALDAVMRVVAIELADEYDHGVANGTMEMLGRIAKHLPPEDREPLRDEYRRIGAEDAMRMGAKSFLEQMKVK